MSTLHRPWPALGVALPLALGACQSSSNEVETAPELDEAEKAEELLTQGLVQFSARNYGQATAIFESAVELAELSGDEGLLVEVLACAGNGHFAQGDLEAGFPWLERAAVYATAEVPRGWVRYLGVRGRYERQSDELEAARATFEELYAFCREDGRAKAALDAAHMRALVAADDDEMIEWSGRALAEAREEGSVRWQAVLWNNLGWKFDELDRLEDAHQALVQARDFHRQGGDALAVLIADWSVAHSLRRLERVGEAKTMLDDVLMRAYALERSGQREQALEWVGFTHWELGEVALLEGRAVEASAALANARQTLVQVGIESWAPDMLEDLDASLLRAAALAP